MFFGSTSGPSLRAPIQGLNPCSAHGAHSLHFDKLVRLAGQSVHQAEEAGGTEAGPAVSRRRPCELWSLAQGGPVQVFSP